MNWLVPAGAFALALFITLVATPAVASFARRIGRVAQPKADRWHAKPTPLLGGIAIFVGFAVSTLVFGSSSVAYWGILAGSTLMFVVGLVDDFRELPPRLKLLGQLVAASAVAALGIHVETGLGWIVDAGLTVFWIVGIGNALNLLDNMDGIAAGTTGIVATFLALYGFFVGAGPMIVLAAALAGAAFGFLAFNFNPARIFMGDVGSLVLGFGLGTLSLAMIQTETARAIAPWHLLLPVLFLAVPVTDTALVMAERFFNGKPIFQGGRDHSTHRLVAIGLTERETAGFLYGISVLFGGLAMAVQWFPHYQAAAGVAVFALLLVSFWSFLAEVPAYERLNFGEAGGIQRRRQLRAILRRVLETIGDMVAVGVAYLSAYLLRWDGRFPPGQYQLFIESLPVVLISFLVAFWFLRLYRIMPRYIGLRDVALIAQGVVLGTVMSIAAIVLLYRFEGYPRSIFVLLGVLAVLLIALNRVGLRAFLDLFRRVSKTRPSRRVAIYGAGDAGELVYRALLYDTNERFQVVGFLDDDVSKHGWSIHGVPVLGGLEVLSNGLAKQVEEVLIALPSAPAPRKEEICSRLSALGIPYRVVDGLL